MSNRIWAILGAIVVPLAVVFLAYYLNLNKPDVRYTLSEEIPLSFSSVSGAGSENVQQLDIRNVGSAGAEKIVVKVSGNITNYKVVKYISSDAVEVFMGEQPVEFVYPVLPPQAGFKIIFTSSNVVKSSDINVSHSTGQAVDALSISNRSSIYLIGGVYILVVGGYAVGLAIFIRNNAFDIWKMKTKGKRIDQALVSSQLWYVSHSKWAEAHLEVIRALLKEEFVSLEKVADCAAYGFLTEGKPDHFSDYDWKELNVLAVNRLKDHLSKSIYTYLESSILSVIRMSKPERFPKDDWDTIQTKAHEEFVERNKRRLYGKQQIVELLHKEKPEAVLDNVWRDLQNHCQKLYLDELIHEIYFSTADPNSVLENNDLEILEQQQKTKLEEIAYRVSKYNDYRVVLVDLLKGEKIRAKKPDTLTDWEWREITMLEDLIVKTKEIEIQNRELAQEIETQKQELMREKFELVDGRLGLESERKTHLSLKNKVLKQLEFINSLLGDPSTIKRVESYDDTFSSGNWENLRQIAALLDSRKGD